MKKLNPKHLVDSARDTQAREILANACLETLRLLDLRHEALPLRLLPADSRFEHNGRICTRGSGIFCTDEIGAFGLDPDTIVKPRLDIQPVRIGGKPSK